MKKNLYSDSMNFKMESFIFFFKILIDFLINAYIKSINFRFLQIPFWKTDLKQLFSLIYLSLSNFKIYFLINTQIKCWTPKTLLRQAIRPSPMRVPLRQASPWIGIKVFWTVAITLIPVCLPVVVLVSNTRKFQRNLKNQAIGRIV